MSFEMRNPRIPFIYSLVLKSDNSGKAIQIQREFFFILLGFFPILLNEHCLNPEVLINISNILRKHAGYNLGQSIREGKMAQSRILPTRDIK